MEHERNVSSKEIYRIGQRASKRLSPEDRHILTEITPYLVFFTMEQESPDPAEILGKVYRLFPDAEEAIARFAVVYDQVEQELLKHR